MLSSSGEDGDRAFVTANGATGAYTVEHVAHHLMWQVMLLVVLVLVVLVMVVVLLLVLLRCRCRCRCRWWCW